MLKKMIEKCFIGILSCMLLITQIGFTNIHAADASDDDFQLFLADYLVDNYMLDKLDQTMAHQILYESMQKRSGVVTASAIYNYLSDLSTIFHDPVDVYEEVILEILQKVQENPYFKQGIETKQQVIGEQLVSQLMGWLDEGHTVIENLNNLDDYEKFQTLMSNFQNYRNQIIAFVSDLGWEDFLKESIKGNFIDAMWDYEMSAYDFLQRLISYITIKSYFDETQEALEFAYRNTQNTQLRTALYRVINKYKLLSDQQLLNFIKESNLGYSLAADTEVNMIEMACALVGATPLLIGSSVGGTLAHIAFKSDELIEIQSLLYVEMEVEDCLKDVIRSKQNTYSNNAREARVFNQGLQLLYGAYAYGTDLAKQYGSLVFEVQLNEIQMDKNAKDMQEAVGKQQEEYESLIKTWDGVIASNTRIFYEAWLAYLEKTPSVYQEAMEDYRAYVFVNGISFDEESITIDSHQYASFIDQEIAIPMGDRVTISPANATNQTIHYSSSDPSVVSIGRSASDTSDTAYNILVHKSGVAIITASTEDGNYTASQELIITGSSEKIHQNIPADATKDYSRYYEENEDGITITRFISDLVKDGTFYIPSQLNGKKVTELNFASYTSYNNKILEEEGIETIVLPASVKRIDDYCFYGLQVDVVLNEGLESIGKYAFANIRANKKDLILPSTLTSLGSHAFQDTSYENIYITSNLLKEIPEYCFWKSTGNSVNTEIKTNVIFTQECSHLTTIREDAFLNVSHIVNLSDHVEVIEKYAFLNAYVDHVPASAVSIEERAFYGATLHSGIMPEHVRTIGAYAFYDCKIASIQLPNNIESIGSHAFDSDSITSISCYGDYDGKTIGSAGKYAFCSSSLQYLEIPASIRSYDIQYSPKTKIVNFLTMYWSDGLDEIALQQPVIGYETHVALYLKHVDHLGEYQIDNRIFNYNTIFDYIEIPYNYLDNTNYAMSYGSYMKEAVIVGKSDNTSQDRYVEILKNAMQEGGKIYYKDENDVLTLLYEKPESSFTKISQASYETQSDYITSNISMLPNTLTASVNGITITASYDDALKHMAGNDANLHVDLWQDGNISEADRYRLLDTFCGFTSFEDLYLKQPYYQYFRLSLTDRDLSITYDIDSSYVVELQVNTSRLTEKSTALYQLYDDGSIKRIPISISSSTGNTTIRFQTNRLTSFALVQLSRMEEKKSGSYIEELHQLYDASEQILSAESPIIYANSNLTLSFTEKESESAGDPNNSSVTISKPVIEDAVKHKIIEALEIDDQLLVDRDEESEIIINEEARKGVEAWKMVEESAVKISANGDHNAIMAALQAADDGDYEVHLWKLSGGEENISLEDASDRIKSVKEKHVPESIQESGSMYYEIDLDEAGDYVLAVTKKMKDNISWVMILGIVIGAVVVLGIVIVQKRRKK